MNFPDAVRVVGNPVTVNGGGFDVITNGSCFENLSFAITDATGRTISSGLPTVTNQPGTQVPTPPTPPTPPAALSIVPGSVNVSGSPGALCSTSRTYQFSVAGGTPPYSIVLAPSSGWIVTPPSAGSPFYTISGAGNTTVGVSDSGGQTATATITCTDPATP